MSLSVKYLSFRFRNFLRLRRKRQCSLEESLVEVQKDASTDEIPIKRFFLKDNSSASSSREEIGNLEQLQKNIACTWQGYLVFRRHYFPIKLYRIYGSEHMIQNLMRNPAENGAPYKLVLTQRTPLSDTETIEEKLANLSQAEVAVMIAVAVSCSLESVINYLLERQAAGVVVIPECSVHIFPPHQTTTKLVDLVAPEVSILSENCGYLLLVLLRDDPSEEGANGF